MKALSVRQPWAWLIIRPDVHDPKKRALLRSMGQIKDIENRTWPTRLRERISIHASKGFDAEGFDWVCERFPDIAMPEEFDLGGIVGTVEVTDCTTAHRSSWFEGPYGFVLAAPRRTAFVPCRGRLGFWEVPPHILRRMQGKR